MLQSQENQPQLFLLAAGVAVPECIGAHAASGEKARLGLSSLKTASHLGFAVCNSITALGLRADWVENRVGAYRCARYYDPTIGRFISEDPTGFSGSKTNFYNYVGNGPINAVDPTGLKTTAIIVYDTTLGITYGSHAALYIDNGGTPILYDPFGSYAPANNCGSGDACGGNAASVNNFEKFHEDNGSTVQTISFNTTPEEEEEIAERIADLGDPGYPGCASSVSNALQGIGPFKGLKINVLPGSLANQLQNLQKASKP